MSPANSTLKRKTELRKKRAGKPRRVAATCSRLRCHGRPSVEGLCKKHAVQLADKLVGYAIKTRDGKCRRCGSPGPLDWAHVVSRRYMRVRWFSENSLALCRPCHYWQTVNPIEGDLFFESIGIDVSQLKQFALAPEFESMADVGAVLRRYREADVA